VALAQQQQPKLDNSITVKKRLLAFRGFACSIRVMAPLSPENEF